MRAKRELMRIGLLLTIASVILFLSVPVAMAVGEPAFAPWGLFAGLALYGVALSHVLRRLMFPYVDLQKIADRANDTPTGAGLVFLGTCIVLATFILLMGSLVRAETIPPNAYKHIPTLKAEFAKYGADMPSVAILAGQVEQETCARLSSPRCWNPRTQNINPKNRGERGVGLGQITRTNRFDALAEIRASYPKDLAGMTWASERLFDPQYQLRALVLKDLQNFRSFRDVEDKHERMKMALSGYNGGTGGVMADRRVCAATPWCDPKKWDGNVELTSLKAKRAGNGYKQSFFEINREYVRNITHTRYKKYEAACS